MCLTSMAQNPDVFITKVASNSDSCLVPEGRAVPTAKQCQAVLQLERKQFKQIHNFKKIFSIKTYSAKILILVSGKKMTGIFFPIPIGIREVVQRRTFCQFLCSLDWRRYILIGSNKSALKITSVCVCVWCACVCVRWQMRERECVCVLALAHTFKVKKNSTGLAELMD